MAEEGHGSENFSFGRSFEDRYKMNMFEIERRLVKLETSVKGILDVMEDIGHSIDLEQIDTEQLKKMLEEQKKQRQGPQAGVQMGTGAESGSTKEVKALHLRLDAAMQRLDEVEKLRDDVSFLKSMVDARHASVQPGESGNLRGDVEEMKEGMSELADSVRTWQIEVERLKGSGASAAMGADVSSTSSTRHFVGQLNAVRSQMRNMHDEMRQVKAEMEHGMSRMIQESSGQVAEKSDGQMKTQIETLRRRLSDMEDSMQSLAELSKSHVLPTKSSMYEDEVNVLLDKVVSLESRVSALQHILAARGMTEGSSMQQQAGERNLSARMLIME